ncbi:preprotein translocase subunit SecG [Mesorhizobium sp. 131-2-1]|uniref:preprotein translocase subunit SecG n=2 Tax=Mesorhizobium TaxID=68287 RepID=UPI001927F22F|nr:preprotein translocase subunit SecG [Mesorhizobium sp. 131-2-1]BCG94553.1 preprotein translocase subunit SecG [Mesorhizobium sp. 131-2-1]
METVLIVVHLMVVLALVGVVLLQRSEGGGLGIGGGSGFMTARGAANALTRATAILAAAFFATSLTLSLVARYGEKPIDILDRVPASSSKGVLDQLPGNAPAGATTPAAPSSSTTPAAPASSSATPAPSGNGAATTAPATAPAAPAPANPATPPAANGVTLPVTPQVPNQ